MCMHVCTAKLTIVQNLLLALVERASKANGSDEFESIVSKVEKVVLDSPGQRRVDGTGKDAGESCQRGLVPSPQRGSRELCILHFNDVYNVEASLREPKAGAARFVSQLTQIREEREQQGLSIPLLLFSGDAFNPSVMSTVTRGEQMPPCLNAMNIQAAVFGNHDFDFGLERLQQLAGMTNFPWLLSNVLDKHTNLPFGGGKPHMIMEWTGLKIGLMGLVESEWLCTLSCVDPDSVVYTDFVETGRQLASQLRSEGAQVIIALTHMREGNDLRLAREVRALEI